MLTRTYAALVAFGVLAGCVMAADGTRLLAQHRELPLPNLSGRWELNRELSEHGETKLERMQSSQGGGHDTGDETPVTPGWVKMSGIMGIVVVLVFVILHLPGGGSVSH